MPSGIGLAGLLILIGAGLYKAINQTPKNYQLIYAWICIFGFGIFDHFFLTLPQGFRVLMLVWGLSMLNLSGGNNQKDFKANELAASR